MSNLNGMSQRNTTWSDTLLKNVSAINTDFTGSEFIRTDLTLANLTGATLTGISSRDVKPIHKPTIAHPLTHTVVSGNTLGQIAQDYGLTVADLELWNNIENVNQISSGQVFKLFPGPTLPINYVLLGGYIFGPDVRLTGANLSGLDLSSLTRDNFEGVVSGDVTFDKDTKWPKYDTYGYICVGGFIIGPGVSFEGYVPGATTKQLRENWRYVKNRFVSAAGKLPPHKVYPNLVKADMKFMDGPVEKRLDEFVLDGITYKLAPLDLNYMNLSGLDCEDANLSNIKLTNANLTGSVLKNAKLLNTNCTNANLTGVILTGANISGLKLVEVDSNGADIPNTAATLTRVKSGGLIKYTKKIKQGTSIDDFVNQFVGLADANVIVIDTDLSFTDENSITHTVRFETTGLNVAVTITGGITIGNDTYARVLGADPILPKDYYLRGGYIIGPGVDLGGAHFDVDLSDLPSAAFVGVKSGGITGLTTAKLPANYHLIDGYIIGPGVDLRGNPISINANDPVNLDDFADSGNLVALLSGGTYENPVSIIVDSTTTVGVGAAQLGEEPRWRGNIDITESITVDL